MADIATTKIFENDKIAVWEMVLEPGESTGVQLGERYRSSDKPLLQIK